MKSLWRASAYRYKHYTINLITLVLSHISPTRFEVHIINNLKTPTNGVSFPDIATFYPHFLAPYL